MPVCFYIGEAVTLQGLYYDVNGVLADPSSLQITTVAPDGTTVTKTGADPEVVKTATGTYTYLLTLDQLGFWRWKWSGTMPDSTVSVDIGLIQVRTDGLP